MIIQHDGYLEFLKQVHVNKKKIICFGAGMIPYYAEDLLVHWDMADAIEAFVDNDEMKWGKTVSLFGREILINSPLYLKEIDVENYILLITCERYLSIINQLSSDEKINRMLCYVFPEINYDYFEKNVLEKQIFFQKDIVIPPIIHYCWFGQKEKSELAQKCIASWKKYCPDFQIIEWNEKNYNVEAHRYTAEAYKEKKWAYVSDIARLEAIYQYGGIYLDTDVELVNHIESLRTYKGFILYGEWPAANSGAGVGCVPGNKIIGEMISTRTNMSFYSPEGRIENKTNSFYESQVLKAHGFTMDMQFQCKNEFALIPADFIAPSSILGEDRYVTKRTLGRHYCMNSWREKDGK